MNRQDSSGTERATVATQPPSGRLTSGLKQVLGAQPVLTAMSLMFTVLVWYGAIYGFGMPAYVLPFPHDVVMEIVARRDLMVQHGLVTLNEILTAFVLSLLIGIPLGMVLSFMPTVGKLLYPLLIISQAVPKVALAPLFLAWFGFSFMTNISIGVLIAVFPVIVNTHLGLQAIDPDLVRLGRSMGATPQRLFLKIRLPVALPSIFAGLKLAITFSAIGAVIGEFVAGTAGLGFLIQSASGRLDTLLSVAAIVVISALAVALFRAVELLERLMLRNRESIPGAVA